MLKRKYLKSSLELIFIFLVIIGGFRVLENKKDGDLYDSDEVAWVFAGYYFNLYFLRFDLFHPDWNDYEAFDHPPLAKYIVGGSLYLKGYTIDSLGPKRFWNNIPINKIPVYFDQVKDKIPKPTITIPFIRSVIFAFALLSLISIYILVRISYGIPPALISTSLIMINPIFTNISIWILAEPILLFFFCLFLLLCSFYLKSKNSIYILLALIVSSLAFLTKLNGLLLVFMLMAIFLIKKRFLVSKQEYKYLILGFIAFLIVTILLNPVFLNTGVKAIGKMVEVRLLAFHQYQKIFKEVALLSIGERFVTATQMIFFKYSPFFHITKVPVELIMFLFGMIYALWRKDLFLITMFVFLVVIPISILPYNTIKYYYWIFPFTHIIAGLSLNLFRELWNRKDVLFKRSQDNI